MRGAARPYYYLGGDWALTRLSSGQPFFVNTRDRGISPWIILGGKWETFVDDILSEFVQPGMTLVDVGANMGYYTVKLGELVGPSGRVFAFEPNPELTEFLVRNIDINGFHGRCVLIPAAAGAENGTAELTFPYSNMGGGFLRQSHEPIFERTVSVDVVTVDDALQTVSKVDIFKIDAEGYEPLVIRGASRVIARSPSCAFLVEIHLAAWERFGQFEELIAPIVGARAIFAVTHDTRLIPLDASKIRNYLGKLQAGMGYFFLCDLALATSQRLQRFVK